MQISREEARRIAALAQLELDGAALDRMAADMTEILSYVEQLESVSLDDTSSDLIAAPSMSDDVPRASLDREAVAANAPSFRDGFFVVPRIVGGEE